MAEFPVNLRSNSNTNLEKTVNMKSASSPTQPLSRHLLYPWAKIILAMNDLRQSDGWARYLQRTGWSVEEVKRTRSKIANPAERDKRYKVKVYIRKIPLIGSVIKIQRPAEIPPMEEIDRIAKKHRALFVKIEPVVSSQEPVAGFEPDPNPNLPTKTMVIDLTKAEKKLWDDLSQDARQSVRKARSEQLTVNSYQFGKPGFDKALNEFHQLLKETGRRQGFWTPSLAQLQVKAGAFGQDVILFLVQPGPLAGAFFLRDGETVYYHHAGSSPEGREKHAPYLLLWEVIKFFRNSDKRLDLEGVSDPRFPKQTKRWSGFTIFKNKFGGNKIEYPRPLIRYYHPLVKLLFSLAGV